MSILNILVTHFLTLKVIGVCIHTVFSVSQNVDRVWRLNAFYLQPLPQARMWQIAGHYPSTDIQTMPHWKALGPSLCRCQFSVSGSYFASSPGYMCLQAETEWKMGKAEEQTRYFLIPFPLYFKKLQIIQDSCTQLFIGNLDCFIYSTMTHT